MQLIIAGDLVPTKSNIELFRNADVSSLLGDELYSLWNKGDSHCIGCFERYKESTIMDRVTLYLISTIMNFGTIVC